MQRIQTVLNVKAQHPTESPVADLCHPLVGSPKMHRFIIPARGVLGFLQEMCDGGCPQRPGLSPWRVEATSFYFSPVSGKRSAGPFRQRGACAFAVVVGCFPPVRAVLFFNGCLAFQKRGKKKEKKTIKKGLFSLL